MVSFANESFEPKMKVKLGKTCAWGSVTRDTGVWSSFWLLGQILAVFDSVVPGHLN